MKSPKKSNIKSKKKNKNDYYDSSAYTSTVDSRLEKNWGYENDSRYVKYKDKPVPPTKVKKKKRNTGLVT